jgi:hypothetical protein
MISTNVYKNYTATLTDLYRRELSAAADIGEITLSTSQKDETSFVKTFLTAAFCFAVIAGLTLYIVNPFKKDTAFPEYKPEVPKPIVSPNTQYVQIQVIEFEDAPEDLEILPSLYNKPEETAVPRAANNASVPPKPAVTASKPTAKPVSKPVVQAKPSVPPPVLYSVRIDGVASSDYTRIKELSGSANITADRLTEYASMWALYVPASGTGMFIEGSEVLPLTYYPTKEEAIAAAERKAEAGEVSILKQETVQNDLYNVTLCCLELDSARLLAQQTGITDKIFQLRRR